MNTKPIFSERGLEVWERFYPYSPNTPEYRITEGDVDFGVWAKPELEYSALKSQIADYLEERDRSLLEEVEKDDILDKNDFPGFYGD